MVLRKLDSHMQRSGLFFWQLIFINLTQWMHRVLNNFCSEIAEETSGVILCFFLAFTADLVTFLAEDDFLSTASMTPVTTICLMSHTSQWPRGGYPENISTHMPLLGTICASAQWPDFRVLEFPPVSCLSISQSFPTAQQACRRCGLIGK